MLLAVAMAAPDALLDALRIPGKVVVDDEGAKLKVDTLGGGLRGNEDFGGIAEVFDEGVSLVGGLGAAGPAKGCVAREPPPASRKA